MTLLLVFILFVADYLYIGIVTRAITKNKVGDSYDYKFRCAGCFVYDTQGKLKHFTGSHSLVGVNDNELTLGLTFLSYQKKYSGISSVSTGYSIFFGKKVFVETKSGEKISITCTKEQAQTVSKYIQN